MILRITEKEWDRKQRALLHDDEMGLKYSELHGRMDSHNDYHYWYEERTDKPSYYRYDYPLPYSDTHYFRRFAELFFSSHSEDGIRPTLAHEFPEGDEVDAEYIESLLIKAEDYGFFTPGAVINFWGSVTEKYPPLPPDKTYILPPLKGGFRESYTGSKANKQRAKIIRKWLKRRATELQIHQSSTPAPSLIRTTVDELCVSPFTKLDLDRLLQHLRLIDSQNNCLTNNLEGKGAGLRSKFTAAYRVLHRARLMEATAYDAEWASAFRTEYHAEIGEAAQKHELTNHGKAVSTSSMPFKKGVDEVLAWVIDWRENQS